MEQTNMNELTYDEFILCIHQLANKIKNSNYTFKNIYGIPRGGLVVAVYLSHLLNIPVVTDEYDINTLIVDDIVDSGKTLQEYVGTKFPNISASIYYYPKSIIRPTFWIKEKTDFVKFPWETNLSAKVDYMEK